MNLLYLNRCYRIQQQQQQKSIYASIENRRTFFLVDCIFELNANI